MTSIKMRQCKAPECSYMMPDKAELTGVKLGPFCAKCTWKLPHTIRLDLLFAPIKKENMIQAAKFYGLM